MYDQSKKTFQRVALGSAILLPAFAGQALAEVADVATADEVAINLQPTQVIMQALEDTSSLGEKLQRLETDRDYLQQMETLSNHAEDKGWFHQGSLGTLLAVLHTVMNPGDVTANMLLGFEGAEKDAKDSISLDDNIDDLIAAANDPENTEIDDPYLRFKAVLGDVQTTAEADTMDHYASYSFTASNVHLDPSPLEKKKERYETDETYKQAVNDATQAMVNNGLAGHMYYATAPYVWGAYLDTDVTWSTLDPIIDEDSGKPDEFHEWHAEHKNRDNNIEAVLQCRADKLPEAPVYDLDERSALFSAIDSCAVNKIAEIQTNFAAYQQGIEQRQDWYYQGSTSDELEFWDYNLLRKAHTDTSITADDLTEAGLTASDPDSYSLADNFEAVLSCRADIEEPTYDAVRKCAGQKMDATIDDSVYPFGKDNVHLDTSPLSEKLARFDTDKRYEQALRQRSEQQADNDNDYMAKMYPNTALPKFLSSFLDRSITWDMIKDQKDEGGDSQEFHLQWAHSNVLDNNMQFVFDCRDDIVPEDLPEDRDALDRMFNQVKSCAIEKTEEQYAPYGAYEKDIANNPNFADTDETSALDFDDYTLLKRAHTEPVTAQELLDAGLIAEDETSQSLAHNFNAVLQCRTGMENPTYDAVHNCAGDKMQEMNDDYQQGQFMMWLLIGLGGLTGVGAGSAYAARRKYLKQNPKPKH